MRSLHLASVAFSIAVNVFGQNPTPWAVTPAGVAVAPEQANSSAGFEQYNPFNGYLNASLPLHHVGGRGDAGFDLVWNLQPGWLAAYNGVPGINAYIVIDPYPSNNIVGATNNAFGLGGPGAVYVRTGFTWNYCSPGYGVGSSVTSVIFVEPNGSQLTLTDTATNGAAEAVPFNSRGGGQPGSWDAGRGTSFRSMDGSQIQFNASSNVLEQNNTGHGYGVGTVSGTLVFPNGLKYTVVNSTITLMEDRNGNAIWLSYGGPQTNIDWYLTVPALTQITDSLNRVTNINYSDGSCGGCLTITYPGTGGAARQVRVITGSLANNYRSDSGPMTVGALFPNSGQPTSYNYNPTVASAVQFPDGNQYTFQYNSYGEVAHVTLPTGGAIEYDYADGAGGSNGGYQNDGGVMIYRRLSQRREYANGGSGPSGYTSLTTHTVGYPSGQTSDTVQVLDPSNNLLSQTVHTLQGSPTDVLTMTGTGCNAWNEGLETQTAIGSSAVVTINNTYVQQSGCMNNPQLASRLMTLNDTNQQSQAVYQYDNYGNVTDEKDYDWGSGAPGTLLRERLIAHQWQVNSIYAATNYNLVRLPSFQVTKDANGNQIAAKSWYYDETGPSDAPGIVGHDASYGAGFIAPRGNVTHSYQWLNTTNSYLPTSYSYDIAGNLLSVTDTNNHATSVSYIDNYSDGQNHGTYALPTAVTNAVSQTAYTQYEYNTGYPTIATDINNNPTIYAYNDPLDRVTQVRAAVNTPSENWTAYTYSGAGSWPAWQEAQQDENTTGDQALVAQQYLDGLGRTTSSYFSNIETAISYDAAGRVSAVSNPFIPGQDTQVNTIYGYDTASRQAAVTTPDGATVSTRYSGNQVYVTDPASHVRETTLDALGRISHVGEDPGGSLNYTTDYGHDALGNLIWVSQGYCPSCQGRTFGYDSLSRLISATNPESGTVSYTYDYVGNLLTRRDNRGTTTTYSNYDGLNRLGSISYSDGITPSVTYYYDASGVANSKGRLTGISNSVSSTNYSGFDALGDVLASSQTTDGQAYSFTYTYNLAGDLTSETYPSGRTVSTTYDGANRPSSAIGTFSGAQTNYVTQAAYSAPGAPVSQVYGNNVVPIWQYNTRLQPVNVYATVGNSPNNWLFDENLNWGGSNNNGTLQSLGEYVGNNVPSDQLTSYGEAFSYDNVNRLTSVVDANGPCGGWCYSRNFNYDQYGNMWLTLNWGVGLAGNTPMSDIYNSANNQMNGQTYDAAGNQLSVNGNTAAYDGENRMNSLVEPSGGGTVSYGYDGNGQRVQKAASNGLATVFVYDVFGQLAAEYSTGSTTPACQTCYLTYDHLGNVRLVTDQTANVIARHDYLPFGEEVVGYADRGSQWFFGATDGVTQRFTGQTRDQESGLDYFNARYFGAALGRFTSPDPANAGAVLGNPQSWNAYSYVWNNPLNAVDPSGMIVDTPGDPGDPCFSFDPSCAGPGPVPPCWDCGGGGGTSGGGGAAGGSTGGGSAPSGSSVPFPPGSFPGGETLGLPPGMGIPGPWGLGLPDPFVFSVCSQSDPNCVAGQWVTDYKGDLVWIEGLTNVIHFHGEPTIGPDQNAAISAWQGVASRRPSRTTSSALGLLRRLVLCLKSLRGAGKLVRPLRRCFPDWEDISMFNWPLAFLGPVRSPR